MESLSVEAVLGLTGLVILVGLAGELIFARTGIPSVLFLMGFGVLLGPVFHLAEPTVVMKLAPYFGTLALLIILFDGGINLHIMKVAKETPLALFFSLTVFCLTIVSIMGFYVWWMQGAWLHGLLLGTILGGTAAAIIIPAMFPRGVATAVMAFLPIAWGIPDTELFPIYALTVIALGVVGMTILLTIHQRWSPEEEPEPGAVPSSP